MKVWFLNLLTSQVFGTIISGVLVFAFSQLFIEYILKPIQRFKELKAKVAYILIYYANAFANPLRSIDMSIAPKISIEFHEKAQQEFREVAALLNGYAEEKPVVSIFIPRIRKLIEVSNALLLLSNNVFCSPTENIDNIIHNSFKAEKSIRNMLSLKARV